MENMMVEGVGVDGKGCTNLKGNLRTNLVRLRNLEQSSGQGNLGSDPRREQLPKQQVFEDSN